MLNFISKLQLPTKILFGATFIVSSLMLFLPMSILSVLGLTVFVDKHRAIIGVCFLVSLAILALFLLGDIKHKINDFLLLIADSVGLGVFTVIGIKVCYYTVLEPSVFLTICCGVITSVGGGVIRDIMSKTTPQIFVKYFYACSSIIGAIVCIILWFIIGELPAMAVGIFTIVFLRILAVKRRWKLPKISY